jgi:hypothetical protein
MLRFDLVILDEIESLLAHFRSVTLSGKGKRPIAFHSLRTYVSTASKVIAADGYFGSRGAKFLLSCRRSMKLYVNCLRNDPNEYYVYEDFVRFSRDALNYIREHQSPMVLVSSDNGLAKQFYKKLCQAYPNKRIAIVNSESDDFFKVAIINQDMWKQMDAVIYTATVGVGVDINIMPAHFGRIFA